MPEQGIITLMDLDAQTIYTYMPDQNMAMKMPFDPNQSPSTDQDDVDNTLSYNPKTIGTESIDGKSCSVIEYNYSGTSVKSWIWKDKGIALRTEMTSSEGTTVMEIKNIDFSDIPDSTFVLPPGVDIIEY